MGKLGLASVALDVDIRATNGASPPPLAGRKLASQFPSLVQAALQGKCRPHTGDGGAVIPPTALFRAAVVTGDGIGHHIKAGVLPSVNLADSFAPGLGSNAVDAAPALWSVEPIGTQ
tara:strand:- start:255 stop:605 length:351 start_codon:yes stop_codon:yes gene_type:complete